jgi:YidC/Oxa1 family membrane protein insertase
MWGSFVDLIANSIHFLHDVLGNWGLAIILFTVAIKLVTWPLTSKQIKSTKAMQELQPKMKELQTKYKDDKEAQTREMMKLYQEMGVNPMMGCFPMLIQFPIWIGLYQAILQLATQGLLGQEGFIFVPSLALPNDISWVMDFASYGQNWGYFVLPILTVVSQIAINKIMTPPTPASGKNDDPTAGMMKQMMAIMPIMFGFFALQFPAGLALYWVTNNALTGLQYFVLNRDTAGATMTLAPVGADGKAVTVIDAQPESSDYSRGQGNGKARRKRKKR